MSTMHKICLPVLFAFLSSANAYGQQIVRIEEDWELHVIQPDEQLDAPQITNTMVPFGGLSDLLFQFDINHTSLPDFSRGGLQVRICDGDECLATLRLHEGVTLSNQAETLRWTQVVQKATNGYYFGVANGQSVSFGAFGDASTHVFVSNGDAGTVSLNAYAANQSLVNSGVTYASNRVGWLRLKSVRLFNDLGQVQVFSYNTDVQ